MPLEISTPALLFPTISLLLLAYTNRFLGLAAIVRKLHDENLVAPEEKYDGQIANLRRRIFLIRDMQTLGVSSLLSCTLCMAFLFIGWDSIATGAFTLSLVLMASSLALSIIEIRISVGALELHLHEMEKGLAKSELSPNRSFGRKFRIQFSVSTMFWMSVVVAIAILWLQEKSKVAKRVETFNRQTTESWSISQIMGPRNTAGFGDISTAWASRSPDSGPEWVIAEFPNEIEATSLEIHESNSPGAVTKVLSVSMTGAESLLWEGKDPLSSGGLAGGISKISFSKPTKTRRVKIVIDSARYPGYNEIDAIALVEGNVNRQWCSQAWASSSYGTNRTAPNWYWP